MKGVSNNMVGYISLHDLTIGYESKKEATRVIASNLNEHVECGTLVCLSGPNGGGKSTLLKTLCRFIPQLSGNISIDGTEITRLSPQDISKFIGVVLTQRGHYNAMTGKELVSLGRTPYTGFFGKLSPYDHELVDKAMEEVGAETLADRTVSSLSDGERQKLLIAKTLAQSTPIIILDEPTAFLDYPSKVEMMRLLKKLCRNEKKIIFISTHDLDIAFATTDYLWLIDKEKGFVTGNVEELGRNGTINHYFGCEGLKFDTATRHFIIEE